MGTGIPSHLFDKQHSQPIRILQALLQLTQEEPDDTAHTISGVVGKWFSG